MAPDGCGHKIARIPPRRSHGLVYLHSNRRFRMFATLTLRRSVPVSLPAWGAIGGFTMAMGFGAAAIELLTAPHARPRPPVEQIAFDRLIVGAHTVPLEGSFDSATDVRVAGRFAAVVHDHESAITLFDARNWKPLSTLRLPAASSTPRVAELAIAPADSGRWIVLDRSHSALDLVSERGTRLRHIALPRGLWSGVAWDSVRRRALVTGVKLDGPTGGSDGRSIHEFDERGAEVAAYREMAPIAHRLQASFNMPFAAIDGSVILMGSSLSNEVSLFDSASARVRIVRVADDWFTPINWELARPTAPPKTIAEPTLNWLSQQTMLTAVIPVTHGRFIARFTQHGRDRERYLYALVDSLGRTRALTAPTTVKLAGAVGDTISGLDVSEDRTANIFVGVLREVIPRRFSDEGSLSRRGS